MILHIVHGLLRLQKQIMKTLYKVKKTIINMTAYSTVLLACVL